MFRGGWFLPSTTFIALGDLGQAADGLGLTADKLGLTADRLEGISKVLD